MMPRPRFRFDPTLVTGLLLCGVLVAVGVSPVASGPSAPRGSPPFGVHAAALLFGPAIPETLPQWAIDQARTLGAAWLRVNLGWSFIERTEGHYDWSLPDTVVRAAEQAGVQLLLTVDGYAGGDGSFRLMPRNPLYASSPNEKRTAYETFLRTMVRRYRGRVRYWQIENEITSRVYWIDSLEQYVELLRLAYRVIKDEDPASQVLIAGFPQGLVVEYVVVKPEDALHQAWVRNELSQIALLLDRTKRAFDILDIHLYEDPETIARRIAFWRARLEELGPPRPIWVTETGGPDTRYPYGDYMPRPPDMSFHDLPEVHRSEVVKRNVQALAGGAERVFWHSLSIPGPPQDVWGGTALIRGQQRTAAFGTYRLLVRKLQGYTSVQRLEMARMIEAYLFKRPTGDVYVLWSRAASAARLPGAARAVVITDVDGRITLGNTSSIPITPIPLFVETRQTP